MHKRLSRSLSKKPTSIKQGVTTPWDEAVLEAESQIQQVEAEAKQKIAKLVESMRMFEALRDSGALFPKAN